MTSIILVFSSVFASNSIYSQSITMGSIKGKILDKSTKQPLPFANILIANTQTGAVTDNEGIFLIKNVEEGVYTLIISYIGYQNKTIPEIRVLRGKTNFIEFELEETVKGLQEVTVKAYKYENLRTAPVSTYGFSREEIARNPGAQGDIFRAIGMLPGVSSSGGQFSAIAVRGQGTRDNVYMVDDIPLVNLGHLDGNPNGFSDPNGARFSIFAPRVIDNAQFTGGGFSAQYGRRSASYLGLNIKEGNHENMIIDGQLDLIGATLNYDGPAYFCKNTSLFFSARYQNFLPVMKMVGISYMGVPEFGDMILKSTTQLNRDNKLTIIGIYSPERMKKDVGNVKEDEELKDLTIFKTAVWNTVLGASLQTLTSKRSFLKNTLYYTNYSYEVTVGKSYPLTDSEGLLIKGSQIAFQDHLREYTYSEQKAGLRSVFTSTFENKAKLITGLEFDRSDLTKSRFLKQADTLFIYNSNNIFQDPGKPYAVQEPNHYNAHYNNFAFNGAVFTEYTFLALPKLNLNVGLRYDYNGYTKQATLSPRLSGSYDFNEKNSLTFASAILFQDPLLTEVADQPQSALLHEERISQFILGYKRYFTPDLKFTAEGWVKTLDRLIVRPSMYYSEQNNSGEGWAGGIDLNLTKRLTSKIHGQIGYSYMQSKRNNNDGYGTYDFTFSQPHQLNLLCSYMYSKHWTFSGKFRYATGKPADSYLIHSNIFNDPSIIRYSMELTGRNNERLPDFISLDLRSDFSFRYKSYNFTAFVDIVDILNRMNPNQNNFNPVSGKQYYDGLAIFPTFGLKFQY